MTNISALVSAIAPSRTLAVSAKAKAMKAQGVDVIGLGRDEPDFGTPDYIEAVGIAAIDGGDHRMNGRDREGNNRAFLGE